MQIETTQPVTFVIFGASGDLAHRKLIPSLLNLFKKGTLPRDFQVVGFAVNPWDDAEFRRSLREGLNQFAEFKFDEAEWEQFSRRLHYLGGDFTRAEDFQKLSERLARVETSGAGRIYYLAVPPAFIGPITGFLGAEGMLDEKTGWRRVVVEKPFGSSYETAHALNASLHQALKEEQIYRIDHYLGKETVQNLLVFRFSNILFEPVWSRAYIDHVQISVLEEVGVGHRGGYYDKAGVLRDMFQNHLLQLLAYTAIEEPETLKHEDLHARRKEVFGAIRPVTAEGAAENTVRAQYAGYLNEPDVASGSQTPTYAALRLMIDNERWRGVPFYLRSGKSLGAKCTEIVIQFKCPVGIYPTPSESISPNLLAICIQPDEGIFLRFEAKVPDTEAGVRPVEMEFHYRESFGESSIPEAYERLLLEVIQGDHTLFVQDDTTEMAWKLIDPIIKAWENNAAPLETYEPGSNGPARADRLIEQDGRSWVITCGKH